MHKGKGDQGPWTKMLTIGSRHVGLDQICKQNFEQNRDPKAMSNLLAKWAVKKKQN